MNKVSAKRSKEIKNEIELIESAMQEAVNEALLNHKRSGDPVVFADEQGRPVWVPAEEIVIPPLDEPKPRCRSKHDA